VRLPARAEGTIKVLDFGLTRAMDCAVDRY
jgi:hypothetical protein